MTPGGAPFLVRVWYIPGPNQLAGSGDMDESRGGSRIVYPRLLPTLTKSDLCGPIPAWRPKRGRGRELRRVGAHRWLYC